MKALDIEAVQAFVHVAELKSFTRAAEVMDMSQSAGSLCECCIAGAARRGRPMRPAQ